MEKNNDVVTINEFAKKSGLKENTVRKLVKENKVYYFKLGRRIYINYPKTMEHLYNSPINDILWNEPLS